MKIILERGQILRTLEGKDDLEVIKRNYHIGGHVLCGGLVSVKEISETENVLFCEECGMRIPFPRKIKTPRKLKEYFVLLKEDRSKKNMDCPSLKSFEASKEEVSTLRRKMENAKTPRDPSLKPR